MNKFLLALASFTLTSTSLCAQTKLYTFLGDDSFDELGGAVARAGDVNADGVPDIIAGGSRDEAAGANAGHARVWSGIDGSLLYTFLGGAASDGFGGKVAGAGDVNGDGFDDVIVASRYYDVADTTGNAQVFSGFDGSVLYTFSILIDANFVVGGVSGAGDVNADGFDDVAVGVPYDDSVGNNSGSVRVFSGATGLELYAFHGAAFEQAGWSLAPAGHVDADGVQDLIVGGGNSAIVSPIGNAWVISGVDGSQIHRLDGIGATVVFGQSVAGIGDVNADGRDDLVVGDVNYDGAKGLARVFSGLDGAALFDIVGLGSGHQLGVSLDSAGDRNEDGTPDILVGLVDDWGSFGGTGAARIFSGVDGAPLEQLLSAIPNDSFGREIAPAGDINGDGELDFVAGASSGDQNGQSSGSVYVLSVEGQINRYCVANPNSTGQAARIEWAGTGSLGTDDLVISASGLPPGQVGLFIRGQSEQQNPLGLGNLCIGGTVLRMFPLVSSDASGAVVSPLYTGSFPYSALFQQGETWKFQFWYRDPAAGAGAFNLSDALSVTFLP